MIKRILFTASCLVPLTGCSFVFVQGPPEVGAGQPAAASTACTDSMILPILDFVAGGANLAYGISALLLGETTAEFEDEFGLSGGETISDDFNAFGIVALAAAGTLGYAGVQGRNKVNRCRQAMAAAASGSAALFATSGRLEREPVSFMQRSVWHDVLDQYRRQQHQPLLPSGQPKSLP